MRMIMLGAVGRVGKFLGALELALERFLAGVTPVQNNKLYRIIFELYFNCQNMCLQSRGGEGGAGPIRFMQGQIIVCEY